MALGGKLKNIDEVGDDESLVGLPDCLPYVGVEKELLLILKGVIGDFIDLSGCKDAQVFNAIFQQLPELSRFLVNGLHLFVQICQHLVHLFLLVVLHAFPEIVHHVDLVLSLPSQHQRKNSTLLPHEMLRIITPLLVHWHQLALVNEALEDFEQQD